MAQLEHVFASLDAKLGASRDPIPKVFVARGGSWKSANDSNAWLPPSETKIVSQPTPTWPEATRYNTAQQWSLPTTPFYTVPVASMGYAAPISRPPVIVQQQPPEIPKPRARPDEFVKVTSPSKWSTVPVTKTKAPQQTDTTEDSEEDPDKKLNAQLDIEEQLGTQSLYKTELCRSFAETGNCRYAAKCQFAHGKEELRPVLRHPKYKTEICKTFHTVGTCPYGRRCRFIHTNADEANTNSINLLPWSASWESSDQLQEKDHAIPAPTPVVAPKSVPIFNQDTSFEATVPVLCDPLKEKKSSRANRTSKKGGGAGGDNRRLAFFARLCEDRQQAGFNGLVA